MIVPRFLVSGPFAHGAGWCSLSELVSPQLYRWTRPCFSGRKIDARTDLAAACPDGTPVPVFQRPQLNKPEPISGSFLALRRSRNWGQKSPSPLPRPADGVVISEPIWE